MRKPHIHPVWTPTDASWLNLIEAQFGVPKRFTVANTDDASHLLRRRRIYRCLRYRHRKVGTEIIRYAALGWLSWNSTSRVLREGSAKSCRSLSGADIGEQHSRIYVPIGVTTTPARHA
jgi:hypothetical protein